jgi:membrane protein YdbS with pleckstrin-like domain
VDVDWLNLLYKKLSTTQLGRIQDVTYKQGGLLDLFFDYGDVFIQTAGTEQNFEFEKVPQPQSVVRAIDELIEERKV